MQGTRLPWAIRPPSRREPFRPGRIHCACTHAKSSSPTWPWSRQGPQSHNSLPVVFAHSIQTRKVKVRLHVIHCGWCVQRQWHRRPELQEDMHDELIGPLQQHSQLRRSDFRLSVASSLCRVAGQKRLVWELEKQHVPDLVEGLCYHRFLVASHSVNTEVNKQVWAQATFWRPLANCCSSLWNLQSNCSKNIQRTKLIKTPGNTPDNGVIGISCKHLKIIQTDLARSYRHVQLTCTSKGKAIFLLELPSIIARR